MAEPRLRLAGDRSVIADVGTRRQKRGRLRPPLGHHYDARGHQCQPLEDKVGEHIGVTPDDVHAAASVGASRLEGRRRELEGGVRSGEVTARQQRVDQRFDDPSHLVVVHEEMQHRDEHQRDRLGEVQRAKAVIDMIKRDTYLGRRDGVEFEPLVSETVWNDANATVAARSFTRSAVASVHHYSGVVHCGRCGSVLYHHKPERGHAKYRCGLGQRGVAESKCGMPGIDYDTANAAIDTVMSPLGIPEQVQRAEGGDAGKSAELAPIKRRMAAAMAKNDMGEVAKLSAEYAERDAKPAAEVRVWWERTGKSLGQVWAGADIAARRELLSSGLAVHDLVVVVHADGSAELADIESDTDA